MSPSFKKTLIILAVISVLGVGGILLVIKEIRYEGSLKRIGESIAQVPGKIIVVSAQKIYQAYCAVTGGEYVNNCEFHCSSTCLHKLGDAGKPCLSSKDCKGRCVVVSPDMSKVSLPMNTGKPTLEPKELIKCKVDFLSGSAIGYDCPPEANIVAKCSQFEDGIGARYENGHIQLIDFGKP